MKQYVLFVCAILLFFPVHLLAQETPEVWTLQECLDYALKNNIQVKKSKINQLSGEEDIKLAKAQLFPSLSASVTQGFVNYPSTDVEDRNRYNGNYSVNSNWQVFDGSRRINNVRQQKIQDEINILGVEQSEDDIRIAIVQTYMQVLYAYEAIRITENNLEVSQTQRDRAEQLLAAGAISRVELSQLESQLSTDRYQLIAARNNFENYKLQLKQLLELDILDDIVVAIPEITEEDILEPLPDKQVIYNRALAVMPEIRSSELNIRVAELDVKMARAGYYPTISLNAGFGTGHLTGTNYTFGSQLWNSFNESFGVTVSVPIFNNRETKTAVNKAKLAVQNSQLDLINSQKVLLQQVESSYLDVVSAQSQYMAAEEQLRYTEESFDLVQEQFNLGMRNTLELLTEKNNLLTAQQQELQAKYTAVMNLQLLNIYQRLPIDIE